MENNNTVYIVQSRLFEYKGAPMVTRMEIHQNRDIAQATFKQMVAETEYALDDYNQVYSGEPGSDTDLPDVALMATWMNDDQTLKAIVECDPQTLQD